MKQLTNAFTFIFSDSEWFNKVLIGGFYFLMIPFGIGVVMLNGFLSEFLLRRQNGDRSMPYWRNSRSLFNAGIRKSPVLLLFLAAAYGAFFFSIHCTVPVGIILLASALTINALFLTGTFNMINVMLSMGLVIAAISVGWMWIVVGWPLLIFLAMLVQVHMLGGKKIL